MRAFTTTYKAAWHMSAGVRARIPTPAPLPRSDMGTVVMGKSEAGVVKKGDTLMVMPNK